MHTNRIKYSRNLTALLFLLGIFCASAQDAERIVGKWQDAGHPEKQIAIYEEAGTFFGKSINDSNNGKVVLKNLIWSETSKNYQGVLISPEGDGEFDIEIEMADKDTFSFSVGKFIFRKKFTFKRIEQ